MASPWGELFTQVLVGIGERVATSRTRRDEARAARSQNPGAETTSAERGTAETSSIDEAETSIDASLRRIQAAEDDELERLEQVDPKLALQKRMQNQLANAQLLSSMSKIRHDASMSIIKNMT
jgi:hypothetical protein